jgi:hypothetical protein
MEYIHPSEDRVLAAFGDAQLLQGSDKSGDNHENGASDISVARVLSHVTSKG